MDREQHRRGVLNHHSVVLDNTNLNLVLIEEDNTPDLDLLDLLAHCSVAYRFDKCYGPGLVDDEEVGEAGGTSVVGSMGDVESQVADLRFSHLEAD